MSKAVEKAKESLGKAVQSAKEKIVKKRLPKTAIEQLFNV